MTYKKNYTNWDNNSDEDIINSGSYGGSLITVADILKESLDIYSLLKTNPEIFNFKRLSPSNLAKLINIEPKFFDRVINEVHFSASDKVKIIVNLTKTALANKIILTEDELKSLPHLAYSSLLSKSFKKYARADLWGKLTRDEKSFLFIDNPKWVLDNVGEIPVLTAERLLELSVSKPEFVDKNISDYTKLSTNSQFWLDMIKFDEKYKLIFLKNTNSCITKSDIRGIIKGHPDIIKSLDASILENSKLTCKEWVLLITPLMKQYRSMFKDWKLSPELVNIINLDLTAEMLTGKSTISTQFTRALNFINGKEEDEDTSV